VPVLAWIYDIMSSARSKT